VIVTIIPGVANRQRRQERALWLMRRDLEEIGIDLRSSRLASGLTLRDVGDAIGVSPQSVLRSEHGRFPPGSSPELLARQAAAVGMRARIKAYPDGDPLRDAAQVELMGRLRARLPAGTPISVEVPVSDQPGDLRAWDAVLQMPGCSCALEFVTRFHDCQSQLRRFQLKLRDGNVGRLIVVVKATHTNRRALAAARDVVDASFPLATRHIMAALAAGRDPGVNGIALL
jgi:transcriptional regulator with XRE-family HTH domain